MCQTGRAGHGRQTGHAPIWERKVLETEGGRWERTGRRNGMKVKDKTESWTASGRGRVEEHHLHESEKSAQLHFECTTYLKYLIKIDYSPERKCNV